MERHREKKVRRKLLRKKSEPKIRQKEEMLKQKEDAEVKKWKLSEKEEIQKGEPKQGTLDLIQGERGNIKNLIDVKKLNVQ